MVLGRVIGTVVSTMKHPSYKGHKLLVVQPMHLPGEPPGDDFLAIDLAHAGVGDAVLVNQEGSGARQITNDPNSPVISVIVGILDSTNVEQMS